MWDAFIVLALVLVLSGFFLWLHLTAVIDTVVDAARGPPDAADPEMKRTAEDLRHLLSDEERTRDP